VTTLELQLPLREQGYIVRKSTDNVEAYDSFLRGVEYFVRTTKENNVQARQLFEKAIALDPQYANAYTMLGWTYSQEWIWRWGTDAQTLERAFELAHQALAIDDSLPMSHSLLSVSHRHKQQHDRAIAEGERAIALDPNNATSYAFQSEVLNAAGRSEEALKMAEQAIRLNPCFPPYYLFLLGWAYYSNGKHNEAVATLKEVLNRNPNYLVASLFLAATYMDQWLFQQSPDAEVLESALAAVQSVLARDDTNPLSHRILGAVYLCQKQYEQAITEVERAIALDPEEAESYALLAQMLSRLGKAEEAVAMLEQALRRQPLMADGKFLHFGVTYYLTGRLEEAIPPLKQLLARYPAKLGFHLLLAAVYSELGKETEARAAAAEVLRINPNFSLEVNKQREPIKDPALLERHIAALRKAGLK
jgi:tetratricopeptide (TPR) repeat protein